MHQIRLQLGFHLRSRGGAYSAPPNHLAGFWVVLLSRHGKGEKKGKQRKKKKVKEKEKRKEERKRKKTRPPIKISGYATGNSKPMRPRVRRSIGSRLSISNSSDIKANRCFCPLHLVTRGIQLKQQVCNCLSYQLEVSDSQTVSDARVVERISLGRFDKTKQKMSKIVRAT